MVRPLKSLNRSMAWKQAVGTGRPVPRQKHRNTLNRSLIRVG